MSFMVGLVTEDFETGDFSQYDWESYGDNIWTVTNSGAYEGTFCAKSGAIGHVSESYLQISLNVVADGEISFYRKVSSEADYDYLQFYFDGQMQDEWSGEQDWAHFSYPVIAGEHTFTWLYMKDVGVVSGSDCGWIDYIIFPPLEGQTPPVVQQIFTIPQGWSGISSYLFPVDATLPKIFEGIEEELIIVQDMDGAYWPSVGMNTIGNWNDHNGYKIKVTGDVNLSFSGYDLVDHTLALDAGWNLIPVISSNNVPCEALFESLGSNLIIAKEVAGSHVYWPGEGVETLENLNSGKSYLVKMEAPGSVTFPQSLADNTIPSSEPVKSANLYDFTPSGNSHVVIFPSSSLENEVQVGDEIFGSTYGGVCTGSVIISDLTQNVALVVFGNDSTSSVITGFDNNELMYFGLIRPSTKDAFMLAVQAFDPLFPNQGLYENEGLSKVLTFYVMWEGINEATAPIIYLTPNPATDKITISGIEKWPVNIEIIDVRGQQVVWINNANKKDVDVSGLKEGMYFIRITSNEWSVVRKLVVE
jgi:hypothetical protein